MGYHCRKTCHWRLGMPLGTYCKYLTRPYKYMVTDLRTGKIVRVSKHVQMEIERWERNQIKADIDRRLNTLTFKLKSKQ